MGRQRLTKAVGHIGWISGFAAFLIFGLLQGALVGGTVGLEAGSCIFGPAVTAGDIQLRIMAGAGMLVGVTITGAMFVSCGLALGRLAGMLIASSGHAAGHGELTKHLFTRRH